MGTENQQTYDNGVLKSPGNPWALKSGRAKPDCLLEKGEAQDAWWDGL